MKYCSRMYSHLGLLFAMLAFVSLAGCTYSRVEWDKAAIREVKKVAVVIYSVPPSIVIRKDPKEGVPKKDKSLTGALIDMATSAMTATNGPRAAEVAHKSFIEFLNKQGLRFKAISADEMRSNAAFMAAARNISEKQASAAAEEARKKEEEKSKQSTGMKALSFLGALSGGGSSDDSGYPPSASPPSFPSFGLQPSWKDGPSALTGAPGEKEYVMEAIKALGVDAAIIINDPGYSWGCEVCIADTGNASTQGAFLITMVEATGESILEMRQWFSIGGGNAVMAAGIINPLQYDGLYAGHGEKTARVFGDYYKEEGGK